MKLKYTAEHVRYLANKALEGKELGAVSQVLFDFALFIEDAVRKEAEEPCGCELYETCEKCRSRKDLEERVGLL